MTTLPTSSVLPNSHRNRPVRFWSERRCWRWASDGGFNGIYLDHTTRPKLSLVSSKLKVASMSSQLLNPNREASIWARLMQSQRDDPSQEVARYLLSIGFGERDRDRMHQLADPSESRTLTDDEGGGFDS